MSVPAGLLQALQGGGGPPPGGAPAGGLPPSISVPGGGGGGADAPEPTNDTAAALVKRAQALIDKAMQLENEPEDEMKLRKVATDMQAYLAGEQKLQDTAMGAGPGHKMIRKATGTSPGY